MRGRSNNYIMAQHTRQLEERLERVEKELAQLKKALAESPPPRRWYRDVVGIFAGDKAGLLGE
jgi:hypothetical protein